MRLPARIGVVAFALAPIVVPAAIALATSGDGTTRDSDSGGVMGLPIKEAAPHEWRAVQGLLAGAAAGTGHPSPPARPGASPTPGDSAGPAAPAEPAEPSGPRAGPTPGPGGSPGAPVPPPATMPAAQYTYSGDLAGRIIKVSITSTGAWTRSESGRATRSGQLTRDQMNTLGSALSSPALAAEAQATGDRLPGQCVDQPTQTLSTGGFTIRQDCTSPSRPTFTSTVGLIRAYTGG